MRKVFDISVFGLTVPVYLKVGLLDSGSYGISDFDKKRIVIDSGLSIPEIERTLAHEIIHFMFFRLNLQLPAEVEEMICETAIIPLFKTFNINLPVGHLKKLRTAQQKLQAS